MGKPEISKNKQLEIVSLRAKGFSVKEISKIMSVGNATSSKYCKGVLISKVGQARLAERRFPAKLKSFTEKSEADIFSKKVLGNLNTRDMFLVISALYWGEGTKRELNLINGDPELVKVFINGLLCIGVKKESIKINIRFYSNQKKDEVTKFWIKHLGLSHSNLVGYEEIESGGLDKLVHGMCRVRVVKSSYFHKVLTSAIGIISSGSSNG